ncbi:MAG: glycosyltransferase family 4 protein [Nitrospirae bacterium]|nr:glycosyltransferase family 4 protein [Nitrospirota bacterium]
MRILHTEASLAWGGQEIRIIRESEGMRARGHQVFIIAPPESDIYQRAGEMGFQTKAVKFQRRSFFSIIREIVRFIESEHIDVVNTHSSKDSWLVLPSARLARNKPFAIRTRHLSVPISKDPFTRVLYNSLPHFIITTGEAIKQQMINDNNYNPDKIMSITTGVNLDLYNAEGPQDVLRKELGLPRTAPLIGTVSVIRNWKGLDYFVKAMPVILKEFPDAMGVMTGDGPDKHILQNAVTEAGLDKNIRLMGHREDVADVLRSLDVLVHPSYANEGVPQTVLQAMALKKPVVASGIEPLKEVVIEGVTGMLSRIKDPESIASAVITLLRNKELAARLGQNGRKLVEASYSFQHTLDKTEKLYGELLRTKN